MEAHRRHLGGAKRACTETQCPLTVVSNATSCCDCTILVVHYAMSFNDARRDAIRAIEEGHIQHEARDEVDEKNLLATGEVTPEQVVRLLKSCRGTQHSCKPHHQVPTIDVHVFKPEASLGHGQPKARWYIKLYFIEPNVWFISVHGSKQGGTP